VLAGRLSVGELVAFNFYILQLIFPLRMTAFLVAQASRAAAAAARVHEVLATEPQIVDGPGAGALPDGPGEVRLESVGFGYEPGVPVLAGLDLVVPAGESVALVGATGAGKSTVARLLARFYDVDAGRVTLDGADVRDCRLGDLRRAVGIVFEDTFLFNDTVRANIALADPDAPPERVEAAARAAGADDFIAGLPDGYDTVLGEQGLSLSGGQRQRIAIARAVLADPRVLVLDDATSSVDPTKEHQIRDALLGVMAGRTTIVIAHRAATVALADRVVLLDAGRVAAEGTHQHLLQTSPAYRAVLAEAHPGPGAGALEESR
jgi:ATP-binding cassette, subfamily B, bacterial